MPDAEYFSALAPGMPDAETDGLHRLAAAVSICRIRGAAVTVYLPIAELSVNIFIILGMGAAVGFLSGMFGVGGGFPHHATADFL